MCYYKLDGGGYITPQIKIVVIFCIIICVLYYFFFFSFVYLFKNRFVWEKLSVNFPRETGMSGNMKRKSSFVEPAPKKKRRTQFDAKLVRTHGKIRVFF